MSGRPLGSGRFRSARDRDGREIDLLFDVDGRLHPLEIKRAATVKRDWGRGFVAVERLGRPVGDGAVVCLAPEAVPIQRGIRAIPVGWI